MEKRSTKLEIYDYEDDTASDETETRAPGAKPIKTTSH